jgi:5-(carboxyamino)imidazole ribonucleotide synthase
LGIIGGGQFGRMLAQKAKQMGGEVTILDPTPNSPAGQVADHQIIGDFYAADKLRELVESCEVTTYDLEHIDAGTLQALADKGYNLQPSPRMLEVIQDKFLQKEKLSAHGLPVPKYEKLDQPNPAALERFGFPLVLKPRRGGYDGRGIIVMKNRVEQLAAIPKEAMIEECIDIEKELAVIVARSLAGEIKVYPVVEMLFEAQGNILDLLLAPARIENRLAKAAQEIAMAAVEALAGTGVFGVEMFLSRQGKLYVNEIAPRPHNSGHYTIEACATSQYEQHLRAITGLPLGSTQLLRPAVMINLLGARGVSGPPVIAGWREALAIPELSFHFYGKAETRALRKMGHVTVLGDNLEQALAKARQAKALLRVEAATPAAGH